MEFINFLPDNYKKMFTEKLKSDLARMNYAVSAAGIGEIPHAVVISDFGRTENVDLCAALFDDADDCAVRR